MLAKWPIRNKLLAGLALLVFSVVTLSASGLNALNSYRMLVKSLSWRADELPLASRLSQRVSDLRVSLSDAGKVSQFHDAGANPPPLVKLAESDFQLKLRDVREALLLYREVLERNEQRNVRIGDSKQERATVAEIEDTLSRISEATAGELWVLDNSAQNELEDDLAELSALSAELPSHLHENLSGFVHEVRGNYRFSIIITWLLSIAATIMLVVFVRLVYQWVFRPLRVLVKGSRRVAEGNFAYRIHLRTRDEMSELAEAMNNMTSRFQSVRDDLDRQVQERTKQVVRSEQLASVGFLAAGVAHEINNPLASIAMCAESLEGRLCGLDCDERDPVVSDYLRMIQDEAFRCKEITEKLLDFSRTGEVKRQNTDLCELVQSVIDIVKHVRKYQGKRVEFQCTEPCILPVNPQEIKQVMLNLIANGLDSTGPDGVVTVQLHRRWSQVEIVVSDNGCGMTAEVLEHLFEPFFTRKPIGQGTGLGLSIVHRIVADHDGQIEASSRGVGEGSQFRVLLPLKTAQKETNHRYQVA